MNEQENSRTNVIHPSNADVIYTHGSPPSSICQQKPVDEEAETGTNSLYCKGSSDSEEDCRILTANIIGDYPEFEDDIRPFIPPLVRFNGNRTNYRHVIKTFDMARARKSYEDQSQRSEALKYFRSRYSTSDWMQQQDGWMENASLLASVGPFSLNPLRILFCSACGKLCCQPNWCRRCNLDQRVEPLQAMFKNAYAKRPFWTSLVLNYEMNANNAGVWTGPPDGRQALYLPHKGKSDGQFLRFSAHQIDFAEHFFDFLFWAIRCLHKVGIIDGWMAVAEPSLSYWPDPNSKFYQWNDIVHAFLPHVHVLVCGHQPFDNKIIRAIYSVLQDFLTSWTYANLWFNPVTSQAGIKKWIDYCVKPFPLSKWYSGALHAGCDEANLNLIFDDIAFENCPGLMSRIHSPRRGGVLATNSRAACILDRLPPMLNREQMAECKNENFYHEHAESFWRTVEKRDLRRGRDFLCRTKSHHAAVRRIRAWEQEHDDP